MAEISGRQPSLQSGDQRRRCVIPKHQKQERPSLLSGCGLSISSAGRVSGRSAR
jgi:hypothetical protein